LIATQETFEKRTPAAKAVLRNSGFSTAEAVPFVQSGFLSAAFVIRFG
jgi:hypothetical protein